MPQPKLDPQEPRDLRYPQHNPRDEDEDRNNHSEHSEPDDTENHRVHHPFFTMRDEELDARQRSAAVAAEEDGTLPGATTNTVSTGSHSSYGYAEPSSVSSISHNLDEEENLSNSLATEKLKTAPQQQGEEGLIHPCNPLSAKKKKKKRQRPRFWLELSASLQDAHCRRHPWEPPHNSDDNAAAGGAADHHQHAYDWPALAHFFQWTAALTLCSWLAAGAAWDAELQCVHRHDKTFGANGGVATSELVDDDAAYPNNNGNYYYNRQNNNWQQQKQQQQTDNYDDSDSTSSASHYCRHMLQTVVGPCTAVTTFCALAVLLILWRFQRRTNTTRAPPRPTTFVAVAHHLQHAQQYPKAAAVHAAVPPPWSSVWRVMVSLFVLFLVILGAQIYHVMAVMLQPAHPGNYYNGNNNNPYQSLAAVDRFGQVGDNANLFYLAWFCVGLATALVYQAATAGFRVQRAAQRHRQRNNTTTTNQTDTGSSSSQAEASTTTSWRGDEEEEENPFSLQHSLHSHRNVYDQSRAAWYSSLYKLRLRTGIWTAAVLSCLIIVAAAQGIWRQVLWPSVQQVYAENNNDKKKDDDIRLFSSYFSVCQAASLQSNGDFTPQLCRRTLAAWFTGLAAAVLCATAIVLHLAARYRRTHKAKDNTDDPKEGNQQSSSTLQYYDPHDYFWVQMLTADLGSLHQHQQHPFRPTALFFSQYYSHHHPKRLSLRTELALSIVLSLLLGLNAILVTSVQGPAATVGNLYYASWLSFLLCIRICLGCVEEFYNIEEDEDEEPQQVALQDKDDNNKSVEEEDVLLQNNSSSSSSSSFRLQQLLPSTNNTGILTSADEKPINTDRSQNDNNHSTYAAPELREEGGSTVVIPSKSCVEVTRVDPTPTRPLSSGTLGGAGGAGSKPVLSATASSSKQEKKRLTRVRGYFFLSVFSTLCAAAAYDAVSNLAASLTHEQLYLMVAPCVVAVLSILLFFLCLSKRCYGMVSRFWVGGVLSIVSFNLLLGVLVLTMHSESSWAVNGVGEILQANSYYFSWASTLTSGVIMTLYVKAAVGIKKLDYMSAFWVAIVKVCFVILGASLHIWHAISDNCEFDEITSGAVTFCSRTVLAIVVSLTGMLVGGLVVLGRLIASVCKKCQCVRAQAHIELLISLFLVFLFIAAVALITGIGGPGQSVGDLYYSTWLAFWVSLGIAVQCYNRLVDEEEDAPNWNRSPIENITTSHRVPIASDSSVLV